MLFIELFAKTEFGDSCFVAFEIGFFELLEQLFALTDHLDETALCHIVVLVLLDVLSNFLDTFSQNRNLNLRRANIILAASKLLDRFSFVIFCNHIAVILAHFLRYRNSLLIS